EAANRIRAEVDPDANIIVGSTFNQELEGKVRVSVVATGIDVQEKDANRPHIKINTGAISKPWRDPVQVDRPAAQASVPASVTVSVPAPSYAPTSAALAVKPAVAPATRPVATAAAAPNAIAANPVGDVHERIRKMLTESAVEPAPAPRAPVRARPAEQARPARNPFREFGKHSLEAAVDMFKSLGAADDSRDIAPPRAPEAPKPSAGAPKGDLFDDQQDADLEIPSFLRKKKIG
ncbi:MAG: hypothetical protein R3C58_16180, partial [Parvularculaceae bacterium]